MSKIRDFQFGEGEHWIIHFQAHDAFGVPLDLTGGVVEWAITSDLTAAPILTASTITGGITFVTALTGLADITLSPLDHSAITEGVYRHEIRVTTAAGIMSTQVEGVLNVGNSLFSADSIPGVGDVSSFKGVYASIAALTVAHATGAAGDWAIVIPGDGTAYFAAWDTGGAEWLVTGAVGDGDKGDITVTADGVTWTIDAGVVTYAKMQDVSATSRILGRKTAAAGDPEECTLSEVLDFIGSAAQGDLLYRGVASWTRLAAGTSGYFLQTQGAGADPQWSTVSGFGDMLAATYDAATIAEQLVGLTAAQSLTNKTLTQPVLTLEQGASVAPTAEGRIAWDTDDDKVKVGDGVGTKTFSDDAYNVATFSPLNRPESLIVAAGDETTAITAGTAKTTFRMPYAFTLTAVRASLTTAQTGDGAGGIFTVDINEGGTTVISTKITIDNTEKTSTTAVAPPVISDAALADDAEITIDVDQIGDGTAKGLKITLIGYQT